LWLEVRQVFPAVLPCVTARAVSRLRLQPQVALRTAGLPLSSHYNPRNVPLSSDSLGVFLDSVNPPSSLFCSKSFMQQRAAFSGQKKLAWYLQSLSCHSRQATLHPARNLLFAPRRRFTPRPWPQPELSSHGSGSPRDKGQRLYAITDRPHLL